MEQEEKCLFSLYTLNFTPGFFCIHITNITVFRENSLEKESVYKNINGRVNKKYVEPFFIIFYLHFYKGFG